MLGQKIIDFVESYIVMENMSDEKISAERRDVFDYIIIEYSFDSISDSSNIECIFYKDSSGGQVRFVGTNLYKRLKKIDLDGVRYNSVGFIFTLYIDNPEDEDAIFKILLKIHEFDKLAI